MSLTEELLEKAGRGGGLAPGEAAYFLQYAGAGDWQRALETARGLAGPGTLQFFAPLYFSNFCVNDCGYCGFKRSNRFLKRKVLPEKKFLEEAAFLWREGHRSLLLIAGEHPVFAGAGQIASYVTALRREGMNFSIAIELGGLAFEDYRFLSEAGISRCLLFQETYDRRAYARHHNGRKEDFDWRLEAPGRAMAAGIRNAGLGILLGLADWRQDLVNLFQHARSLKEKYGIFPATFSFPRLRPAAGVSMDDFAPVTDSDFLKILIMSRLACPETGIVLTTRESPLFRAEILEKKIGITHMSAGASTEPGGYTSAREAGGQFDVTDHRSLMEVVQEAERLGYQAAF